MRPLLKNIVMLGLAGVMFVASVGKLFGQERFNAVGNSVRLNTAVDSINAMTDDPYAQNLFDLSHFNAIEVAGNRATLFQISVDEVTKELNDEIEGRSVRVSYGRRNDTLRLGLVLSEYSAGDTIYIDGSAIALSAEDIAAAETQMTVAQALGAMAHYYVQDQMLEDGNAAMSRVAGVQVFGLPIAVDAMIYQNSRAVGHAIRDMYLIDAARSHPIIRSELSWNDRLDSLYNHPEMQDQSKLLNTLFSYHMGEGKIFHSGSVFDHSLDVVVKNHTRIFGYTEIEGLEDSVRLVRGQRLVDKAINGYSGYNAPYTRFIGYVQDTAEKAVELLELRTQMDAYNQELSDFAPRSPEARSIQQEKQNLQLVINARTGVLKAACRNLQEMHFPHRVYTSINASFQTAATEVGLNVNFSMMEQFPHDAVLNRIQMIIQERNKALKLKAEGMGYEVN